MKSQIIKALEQNTDELMTPREVEKLLKVSKVTLWRLVKNEGLNGYRVSAGKDFGRLRFFRSEVLDWVRRQRSAK